MKINSDDFQTWWSSPVGLEFRKMLKENLDLLAYGTMTHSFARDHIGNAIEVGKFQATVEIYNMDYYYLTGEIDEPNRNKAD